LLIEFGKPNQSNGKAGRTMIICTNELSIDLLTRALSAVLSTEETSVTVKAVKKEEKNERIS
jgi:hypothetical protein